MKTYILKSEILLNTKMYIQSQQRGMYFCNAWSKCYVIKIIILFLDMIFTIYNLVDVTTACHWE